MSEIVNLGEHAEALQAEVDQCRSLLVSSGLCKEDEVDEKIISKYRGQPAFFRSLNTILARGFQFHSISDFYFALSICNDTVETVAYLEATVDITDQKEFETVWKLIKGLWHKESKQATPVPFVERLRAGIGRIRGYYPDAFISEYKFDQAELMLARSIEPRHDLGHLYKGSLGDLPNADREKLAAYYDAGHHYIAHPNIFGQESYKKDPLPTDEIEVRKAIARLDNYPPLDQQDTIVAKIVAVPDTGRATKLLSTFIEREIDLVYFEKLLKVMAGEAEGVGSDRSPIGRIINAITAYQEDDLVPAIIVLTDIMANDPDNLEHYLPNFEAGEIAELEREIYRKRLAEHAEKFPEKPLDEVRTSFLTPENEDTEVVDTELLERGFKTYEAVLARGQDLVVLDEDELMSSLRKILPPQKSNEKAPSRLLDIAKIKAITESEAEISAVEGKLPHTPEEVEAYRVEFFALVREIFKREFGVYPYNTQMLAILMMIDETVLAENELKGTYEQIKTGEGKSLILALTSAYFGSLNQNVDLITSNGYLARRDGDRFSSFYSKIGLASGSFARDGEQSGGANPRILYTTNADLIFHYLSCRLHGQEFFDGARHEVALVDEADNLCIDLGEQACRIAQPSPGLFAEPTMRRFMEFADIHAQSIYFELPEAVREFQRFAPETADIHPIYIGLYLRSALRSKSVTQGEDYIIRDDKVVIVDVTNTGRIQEKTHWGQGLHEFVVLRNDLNLPEHQGVSAQMNHPHFIRMYDRIHCISGTFGDTVDRHEIQEVYNLQGFDVPPHHRSSRIDDGLSLEFEYKDFSKKVLARAAELSSQGRPVLIVASSINESQKFYEALLESNSEVQLLNDARNINADKQPDDEENIVARAGESGMITVATSVAGRGADVIPNQAALEAGGLHSLLTFMPTNKRVEYQARGRAGRQGKPGTSEIMVCFETDLFMQGLGSPLQAAVATICQQYGKESRELSWMIELIRKCKNLVSSQARVMNLEKEDMILEALNGYFGLVGNTTASLRQANPVLQEPQNHGAASFLASEYLSDTWITEFDYLQTVIQHDDLLEKSGTSDDTEDVSQIAAKLDGVFSDIFGVQADQQEMYFDQGFMKIVSGVYQHFRESLVRIERRVNNFDPEKVRQMMMRLEQKTQQASVDCVTELGGANVVQLKDFLERRKKREPDENP